MNARPGPAVYVAGLVALLLFAGFMALGIWQIERRAWKLELIKQVGARAHAAPAPPQGPAFWGAITAPTDAYRRIRLDGTLDNTRETLVRAATALGSGYWVVTPLRTTQGFTVLVNRGYVSPEQRDAHAKPTGPVTITGYLRITEPGGGFLRNNDPATDKWYSRDVAAIAAARGLTNVAPYFVDADKSGTAAPIGGQTIIAFPNNHLVYMLTWFALAAMTIVAFVVFVRQDVRKRRGAVDA
ncbi:surfeit locus 1 family protein [Sphingomonas sp. BK036]|uniref:SURF1 family protein n=1 Tax=Sphingomonas sp. BK036 TaxID=2512122 RepID=UPI00102A2862|nr:SURF1 family protein [Sphingomonas sp. BK036]RZT56996.1 surfeit locus 1 family protein [Sphingomonas sp. BK036]